MTMLMNFKIEVIIILEDCNLLIKNHIMKILQILYNIPNRE